MKYLKKFKTNEELNNESYKFPYPCVAMSTDGQGNQDVHFEPEQSWVKCKYSIPDDVFDENGYVDLMLGARGYIKSYKVNGKYAEIEPEQRIEGVATEVFGKITIEGTTMYAPLFEHCPEATTITSEMTFTLSRTVQPTDYVFMCAYDGEGVLQMCDPMGTVQELISAGYYDMYFTFLDDTHYSYGDVFIAEMPGMAGFHMFAGIVDPEYIEANALQMPTLKTYMQSVQILGGIKNIGVNKSDLDENGECEIEYRMEHVETDGVLYQFIDTRFNSDVLKEIDFSSLCVPMLCRDKVFWNITSLTKIVIGKNFEFETETSNAFQYCPSLIEIIIDNNDKLETKYNAIVLKETNTIFSTCASTIYIDANNVNISNYAFANNTGLSEFTIKGNPSVLTTFAPQLKKLSYDGGYASNFPSSVEHLCLKDVDCDGSYSHMTNLKTIELTNVGFGRDGYFNGKLFNNLSSLTDIIIHSQVERADGSSPQWYAYPFEDSGVTNVTFYGDVYKGFSFNQMYGTPWYSNTLQEDYVMVHNTLIFDKNMIGPLDNTKYLGKYLYANLLSTQQIASIDLKNVIVIGASAFRYCENLKEIIIPSTVIEIDNDAFLYSGLQTVYLKSKTPPTIYQHSISNSITFYVPTDAVDEYKSASIWSNYADRIIGYDFE